MQDNLTAIPGTHEPFQESGMAMDVHFEFNGTDDYEDYYKQNVLCVSAHEDVFIPIILYTAFALGLLGNALVLAVLWQKRRSWRVTDTFVFNLTLADILLVITLPFWAINATNGWPLCSKGCQTIAAIFKINIYFGMFVLTCISSHYLLLIVKECWMYSHQKLWAPHATCLLAWIAALILSIGDWVDLKSIDDPAYLEDRQWCPVPISQNNVGGVIFLVMTLIVAVGWSVLVLLLKRQPPCQPKERRGIWLILALTSAFFITWSPYNIALVINPKPAAADECQHHQRTAMEMTLIATATIGCMQCFIKPVVYLVMASEFRTRLLNLVRCLHRPNRQCNHKTSLWHSVVEDEERGDIQEKNALSQNKVY